MSSQGNLSPVIPQPADLTCEFCGEKITSQVLYAVADGHGGWVLMRLHPECVAEEA